MRSGGGGGAAGAGQDMGSSEQKGNNTDARIKAKTVGAQKVAPPPPSLPPSTPGEEGATVAKPKSKAARNPKAKKSKALFNLDVNIGNGVTGRIVVRRGDDPMQLARAFCARHSLPDKPRATERLVQLIEENVRVYVER